jgi:hypothetical protein
MSTFCLYWGTPDWSYNGSMRFALLLTLSLSGLGVCQAQDGVAAATPVQARTQAPSAVVDSQPRVVEQRTEHIRVEDGGSRIDELRIGGETKSIEVQPKGGLPAYQVQAVSGERSWKILGF